MEVTKETLDVLRQWVEAKAQIATVAAPLVENEMKLRRQLFDALFPAPKEGTNNENLPNGWKMKGTYKIERKIDEAALPAVAAALRDTLGINPDPLIRWKPDLDTKNYKALGDEARKVFDSALTIKPSTPTLELIAPPTPKEKA